MKYAAAITAFVIGLILIFSFGSFNVPSEAETEYLRIHIRANSNSDIDQSVKYAIKDKVVDALVPVLADCKSKEDAEKALKANFKLIENAANKTLSDYGFSYKSKAKLVSEYFPVRSYEDLTLDSGIYDALIIELGDAAGDNWWCVVYPPLCFVQANPQGDKVIYRSRILEIIEQFFR